MFHLLFLAAQFLSIKIVSQKAEKCNHIPRLGQITSHFSLILCFDMFLSLIHIFRVRLYYDVILNLNTSAVHTCHLIA